MSRIVPFPCKHIFFLNSIKNRMGYKSLSSTVYTFLNEYRKNISQTDQEILNS